MTTMPKSRIKLITAGICLLILIIFTLLNMQVVEVDIIVAKVETRRSFLILGSCFVGLFAGWALRSVIGSGKSKFPITTAAEK